MAEITYADAGVDIEEGAAAVDAIKDAVHSTYRPEVVGDIGGFGGLFETLFGFRVVGVVVGVVLQCHLAVSPLDFVFRRIAGYTENFIIIALGHSGSNLSRQKGLVVHVRLLFDCGHTILGHILREDLSGGDFTQRGHGFLVARLDQRLVAFTVLSHAFDRHLYEEKPVFDAFLTVFNGDACHSAASKKDGLLPIS